MRRPAGASSRTSIHVPGRSGAGSGKTTKLVDRVSAILALGKAEVGRIAAVTFTGGGGRTEERLQQRLEERAATIRRAVEKGCAKPSRISGTRS